MLGALAFVTVRQKHCQSGCLLPLVLAGCDILVDNRLSDIVEIAKLRFPHHQRISGDYRIAIFKAEHAGFGERAVKNFKAAARRICRTQLSQRLPFLTSLRVVENGVTLAEGAAA